MRRLLVVLPLAFLLAACGGDTGESEQAGEVVQTIQISETEFALEPSIVRLSKTGTYEFKAVNDGEIVHALEIEGHGIEAETENIEPGATMTLRVTLSESGSYEMYCPVDGHKEQGMDGSVTVGSGAGAGTTTGQTTTNGY